MAEEIEFLRDKVTGGGLCSWEVADVKPGRGLSHSRRHPLVATVILLHPEVFPSRFGFLGLCCVFPWPRERCPMPVIYILA